MYSACQFKEKCTKLHDIQSLYNEKIITQRKLRNVNNRLLVIFLKLSQAYKVSFCRGGSNCSDANCDSFHYCYHEFIKGNCSERVMCTFGHQLDSNFKQNYSVLFKRNIHNLYPEDFKNYLIQSYNGYKDNK